MVLGNLQRLGSQLGRLVGRRGGPPDLEMHPTDGGWQVTARLPGVAPEEVAVEVDAGQLRIRARSEAEVNADHGMPGMGAAHRTFEYQLRLPSEVDADRMDAVMDHGLLTVTMPRGPASRRSITVGRPAYETPRSVANRRRTTVDDHEPPRARMNPGRIDPAADREMHHPNVGEAEISRQQDG
ncbi:HSP20 family protein [Micromonospora pattaloongensis]|uniref:HSP20 family protein n=2 Tax=Micromonospora pattaloongensis TaxID=405436 RepID=A0A1H3SLT9_9ACTN|nr:HSP20 family protein [Micromonospora pattaloongensis]